MGRATEHRKVACLESRDCACGRRHPAPYRPAQTTASPGMSDGTPFLRGAADRIGALGSPAKMSFRATNAANWSSIIRIGAKMAVIRRRVAHRAVSNHTQRDGGFHMENPG